MIPWSGVRCTLVLHPGAAGLREKRRAGCGART
jgi:hypothetical protein